MALSTTSGLGNNWGDLTGSTLPPLGGPDQFATDKEMVDSLRKLWRHEYQIRLPHEKVWDRSIDRYNGIYDHSKKRGWQSKRVIPGYTILTQKVAWELTKPVALATGPLFEVTTDLSPWRDLLDIPAEILNDQLKSNGENPAGDLSQAWYKCMLTAAQTGNCYMLILPELDGEVDLRPNSEDAIFGEDPFEEEMEELDDEPLPSLSGDLPDLEGDDFDNVPTVDELNKKFRIRFEALNPRDVLPDSSNPERPTYIMWRQQLTPFHFRKLALRHGWSNVEEIIQSAQTTTETDAESKRRDHRENMTSEQPKRRDNIFLYHVMGSPLGQDGEAIFENKYCSWAGEYIVQEPQDLKLWHGRIPIVCGGMMERAFGAYHQSLAVLNLDPQEARNELLNSLLDYLHQVINPPTEIDHDQLHQSFGVKQLAAGITPGGVLHLQKMGKNFPAVSRGAAPDMPTGVWQGLGFIKNEWAETTGLSDVGTPRPTRNRISADEAAERQMMSGGIWQQAILNLETKFLSPTLYQSYLLGLQKITDDQWKAKINARIERLELNAPSPPGAPPTDNAPEPADDSPINPHEPLLQKLKKMLTWNARKRWNMMAATFRFEPKVFSSTESRRRNLEKLSMLTQAAEKNPALMQSIRWRRVAEQFVLALELDPDDLLWPDEGETAEQPMAGGALPPDVPAPVNPVVPPPPGPR